MKKIIPLLLITCLFFTGCLKRDYHEINYNQFMKMIEDKKSFVMVVGAENCDHCKDYHKTMKKVIKDYQLEIYYINVYPFTDEEKSEFMTIINYSGTPTTVFIEEGKEKSTYNRVEGAKSYDTVIKKLKQNGYIKE